MSNHKIKILTDGGFKLLDGMIGLEMNAKRFGKGYRIDIEEILKNLKLKSVYFAEHEVQVVEDDNSNTMINAGS